MERLLFVLLTGDVESSPADHKKTTLTASTRLPSPPMCIFFRYASSAITQARPHGQRLINLDASFVDAKALTCEEKNVAARGEPE
jgi:hypothetical protein